MDNYTDKSWQTKVFNMYFPGYGRIYSPLPHSLGKIWLSCRIISNSGYRATLTVVTRMLRTTRRLVMTIICAQQYFNKQQSYGPETDAGRTDRRTMWRLYICSPKLFEGA